MIKNIDIWLVFARNLGLGVSMEDIVLVTGCHLARSWANVAFSVSQAVEQVALRVKVVGASNVEWQFSRDDTQGVAYKCGPSGKVRFSMTSIRINRCRDSTGLNLLVSEPARGSVHIRKGVPCHPTSEDITNSEASRSSRANSGSRRR
jgi:hypothetical protein